MKHKKVFILFLLIISMIIPDLRCFAASSGYWTDASYRASYFSNVMGSTITIMNAAELALLAYNVNNGCTYSGYTIQLGADIDLSGHYWTPIGTSSYHFQGVFDGRGYAIKNVDVCTAIAGFFIYVGSSGVVRNLTITGSIVSSSGRGAAGITVFNYGKVYNCLVLAYINSEFNASTFVTENYGILENCAFGGTLTSACADTAYTSRFNYGSIKYCYYVITDGFPYDNSNDYDGGVSSYYYKITQIGTTCTVNNTSSFVVNGVTIPANSSLLTALNAWVGSNTATYCTWRTASSTSENKGFPVQEKLINVTITWGAMTYNYVATWNTSTRTYSYAWQRTSAGTSDRIYIQNNSACAIKATATYTALSGYSSISGYFTNSSGTVCTYITISAGSSGSMYLTLSGSPSNYTSLNNTSVGTITISVSRQ